MLRVAILGYWHVHARDYAREALAHPATEIASVWDDDPARGQAAADALGVPFAARLADLLADPNIDGVVVTTATAAHREVMLAAARAGKHIFAEKVIAPTWREAREIAAAATSAAIIFVVALRHLGAGLTVAIKEEIAGGSLGDVTYLRVRVAHDGALRTAPHPDGWLPARFFDPAEAAGGALIDLGCHPLYLIRHFWGMPEAVSVTYGAVTDRGVEDHAVVTLHYPNGAIGVAEVGFLDGAPGYTIEAHGSGGSLLYGPPDERMRIRAAGADRRAWSIRTDLPPDAPSPFAQWVEHVQAGTAAPVNVASAVDLSALVEAANRSAVEGRVIGLDAVVDR